MGSCSSGTSIQERNLIRTHIVSITIRLEYHFPGGSRCILFAGKADIIRNRETPDYGYPVARCCEETKVKYGRVCVHCII